MSEKIAFLTSEMLMLSWGASVQRANLYRDKQVSQDPRAFEFREKIMGFLSTDLLPRYTTGCTESSHYDNLESLVDYANTVNPGILGANGYKFGIAQKLLNLALKYHWCLGLIAEPPHCPVDRIIISKTKYDGQVNWTQMTNRDQYHAVIEAIRELAAHDGLTIPVWELQVFSRR